MAPRYWVCYAYCVEVNTSMSETLSIRTDSETKQRLDANAKRTGSILAGEEITPHLESEEWQVGEIQKGIEELETGQSIWHDKVSQWMKSWGRAGETEAPR